MAGGRQQGVKIDQHQHACGSWVKTTTGAHVLILKPRVLCSAVYTLGKEREIRESKGRTTPRAPGEVRTVGAPSRKELPR